MPSTFGGFVPRLPPGTLPPDPRYRFMLPHSPPFCSSNYKLLATPPNVMNLLTHQH